MAKRIGLHENRTRVMFHLPLNDTKEEKAANKVVQYLQSQKQEDGGVKGFTHSVFRQTVFRGWWWSQATEQWCQDQIVLFMVDLKIDFADQRLSAQIRELKKTIRHWYRYFGKPQEEIWVVAHPITRFD